VGLATHGAIALAVNACRDMTNEELKKRISANDEFAKKSKEDLDELERLRAKQGTIRI
jgi:hypothetical protein